MAHWARRQGTWGGHPTHPNIVHGVDVRRMQGDQAEPVDQKLVVQNRTVLLHEHVLNRHRGSLGDHHPAKGIRDAAASVAEHELHVELLWSSAGVCGGKAGRVWQRRDEQGGKDGQPSHGKRDRQQQRARGRRCEPRRRPCTSNRKLSDSNSHPTLTARSWAGGAPADPRSWRTLPPPCPRPAAPFRRRGGFTLKPEPLGPAYARPSRAARLLQGSLTCARTHTQMDGLICELSQSAG